MNEELNEILKFHEDERQNLEALIDENIKNGEYKEAHRHQKALFKVNRLLSLLLKLENPNYEEIEQLQFRLQKYSTSAFQKLVDANPRMINLFETEKKHFEQKIKLLKEKPLPQQTDGQEFDDVIFGLAEGKIKKFKFFLNLETHLYIAFKKSSNSIVITIPKYKKLKKNYILSKSNIKKLKGMGFRLNLQENALVYNYYLSDFKNAIEIKEFTSRIIYDGFEYHNIKNSSLIVILK